MSNTPCSLGFCHICSKPLTERNTAFNYQKTYYTASGMDVYKSPLVRVCVSCERTLGHERCLENIRKSVDWLHDSRDV